MGRSVALLGVLVLALPCASAGASPRPGVGSLGAAAGLEGDLPRATVASTRDLAETTGAAAVLSVSNIKLLNPGDVIDAIGDLGGCVLDPITGIPDDPSNVISGPAEAVGCVAGEATGAAGEVVGGAVSEVAGGIADEWTKAVLEGASWLMRRVATAVDQTTAPNLGAAWFRGAYETMGAIALLLVVPLLFFSLATALVRRDSGQAIRSAFVSLPMAFVLSACALTLTQLGLAITDWGCAAVVQTVEEPGGRFLASTSKLVAYDTLVAGPGGLPTFVALGAGLLAFLCAVAVWIEFVIRDAAVYLSAFFLPLAFAGAVWLRTARASRRIVGLLVAVVFSKFVIVAVLSLAGRAAFAGTADEGIEPLLAAIAMLLLAVAAPAALIGLVSLLDDDGVQDGLRRGISQATMRLPVPGPQEVMRNVARQRATAGSGQGTAGMATLMALQANAQGGQDRGHEQEPPGGRGGGRGGGGGGGGPRSTERPGGGMRPAEHAVGRVADVAESRGATSSPLRAQIKRAPEHRGSAAPASAVKPTTGPRPTSPSATTPPPSSPRPTEAHPATARPDSWRPEPSE